MPELLLITIILAFLAIVIYVAVKKAQSAKRNASYQSAVRQGARILAGIFIVGTVVFLISSTGMTRKGAFIVPASIAVILLAWSFTPTMGSARALATFFGAGLLGLFLEDIFYLTFMDGSLSQGSFGPLVAGLVLLYLGFRKPKRREERDANAVSYCPSCKAEYRDGFNVCSDCGVDLTRYQEKKRNIES